MQPENVKSLEASSSEKDCETWKTPSKLVKCMPREWKTKTWLTESGHILISHAWAQKVGDGWSDHQPKQMKEIPIVYTRRLSGSLHSHTWRQQTAQPCLPPLPTIQPCPQYQTISGLWKCVREVHLLSKHKKLSELDRNKRYRQDGTATPVQHRQGRGRKYPSLQGLRALNIKLGKASGLLQDTAVNPNTAYCLLQSGIPHFLFCCLHGIISYKQTHLMVSETSNSIILPQHLLIIKALPNIWCFHWLKAHA